MSYVQYAQKQYTLDLLRQPTVIIFSPKVIKKAALYESYEQLRKEDFQLQLVNTRLVKQLIKNSCFMFLKPILTGPIMIAYSPKKVDISTLLTIAPKVSDKLSFTASLLDGKLFLTKNRLDLISINPYHQLYSVFILYFLYNIKCLEHKLKQMRILQINRINKWFLQSKKKIAVDKCPQKRVTCLQVYVITKKWEYVQHLFLIIMAIVVYFGEVAQILPVYVLQDVLTEINLVLLGIMPIVPAEKKAKIKYYCFNFLKLSFWLWYFWGLLFAFYLFFEGKISIEFLHIGALLLFFLVLITPILGRFILIVLQETSLNFYFYVTLHFLWNFIACAGGSGLFIRKLYFFEQIEITPYGFVNFYDKFYQNHGVILKKPITNAQKLVNKALVELDDYYRSPDFINRLTDKLVGQELPTNSDQLTFLFEKLIKEVKTEMIVGINQQKNLESVNFFQQALETTVNFATNHPYIFGAACIATAVAAGYFLYPYVKTLLGIGGSAVAGSSTGNSSGNNATMPHNNLRVPTSAVTPANEEIRKDVLNRLRLRSDKATSYATDAANMANNIADKPKLKSISKSEELLDQLKIIEKKILVAEKLATQVTNNAPHFPGNQKEIARIIDEIELTQLKANYVRRKIDFIRAQINARYGGVSINVNELTSQNVDNINNQAKRLLAKKVLLAKEKYENAQQAHLYSVKNLPCDESETVGTPVTLSSATSEHKVDILDSFS